MLSSLLSERKHQFCLNFAEQMEISVQGDCMESGFVMGAVRGRNAQAIGRVASARTDRRLHSTPMRAHKKGLHEGTPCRPLIG